MAAVRRVSESGVVVALVVCLVLAFAGLGCAVWFYQQLSIAKKAIAADQAAVADTIHSKFRDNGWELVTQSPPQLGVTYVRESYEAVAGKLAEAAEYEKVVRPMLGWESVEGVRTAMAESPAQRESEAQGKPAFATVSALLKYYEDSYGGLSQQVADLTKRNADLSSRIEEAQQEVAQTRDRLQAELNRASENFRDEIAKLREGYTDLQTRHDRQAQDAVDWRQKYQQEADAHRQEVAGLTAERDDWRGRYEDAVAGPGERERLVAVGEVIEVQPKYDFVMIQGGRDREFKEDDRFIVYDVTPDGKSRRKGEIVVGKVNEHTCLATIADEQKGLYIVSGDLFVSLERWNQFHRETTAEAGTGG